MKRVVLVLFPLLGAAPHAAAQTPSGWRAHDLDRPHPPVVAPGAAAQPVPAPSDAVVLFDGTGLAAWRNHDGGPAGWTVRDGAMEAVPGAGFVYTRQAFGDVQLHVEWAAPTPPHDTGQGRGNSGVFLMEEYELQVLDSWHNDTYADGQAGAAYGQYPPLVNAALPPGTWQSYDIVFRRPRFDSTGALVAPARMTAFWNGVLVQDDVALWGPTNWLQANPYLSGPTRGSIGLQDHGNPVRYRNIWARVLPEGPPPVPTPVPTGVVLAPEQLDRMVGAYRNGGTVFTITRAGPGLSVDIQEGRSQRLIPLSATEFAMGVTSATLTATPGPSGRPSKLTFHMGATSFDLTAVP